MIPHPSYAITSPCEVLKCVTRQHAIRYCIEKFCPYRWQRQSAEDRARDAERDAKEKERMRDEA